MRISDWSSDVCSSDLETHIADGRARLAANAQALGGDRLTLRLDASPEDNRLNIECSLNAPADGLIASLAGFDRPVAATLSGKGDWEAWQGRLSASYGGGRLDDIDRKVVRVGKRGSGRLELRC